MEIDTETVLKIARLSRIKINESESADIQKDLNRIVEFVKKLGEIDVDGIDEFNFGKTKIDDMRKDSVTIYGNTDDNNEDNVRNDELRKHLQFRFFSILLG